MTLLPFFIVVPLAGAILIALLSTKGRRIAGIIFFLSVFILCALSLYAARLVLLNKVVLFKAGGWLPPLGILLVADGLSALMLIVVNVVAFLVAFYALRYMQKYAVIWKFYSLYLFMAAGANGVVLSGDLFNLYVFLELASLSAYCLVAFGFELESLEAAFRYAIMGSLGSVFVLLGIGMLYGYTSTLNMADMALVLSNHPRGVLIGFVSVLFLAGLGLKAAIVPFHAWLPDAHSSAPSPVSAMLSGVIIKALGIYAMARIMFNVLGVSGKLLYVFMILGAISMIVGALMAMSQSDIKRMFAYSSISQVGYIILAFGIGTPLAIFGGLFHLFNHAFFKSLLFLNAGAIEHATGTRNLNRLGGLARKMPQETLTSLVGSMSISGVPPLGGFWSKLIIIMAAIQAGYMGFAAIAVIVSIITLAYYLEFQTFAFFGEKDKKIEEVKEVPQVMRWPLFILAAICVFSGLLLLPAFRQFLQSAADVVSSGTNYKDAVFAMIKW